MTKSYRILSETEKELYSKLGSDKFSNQEKKAAWLLAVQNGLDPKNSRNTFCDSALLIAIYQKNLDLVEFFLEQGVDPNLTNTKMRNALHVAAANNVDVINILDKHGVDINSKDIDGKTALQIAREKTPQNLDIIRKLELLSSRLLRKSEKAKTKEEINFKPNEVNFPQQTNHTLQNVPTSYINSSFNSVTNFKPIAPISNQLDNRTATAVLALAGVAMFRSAKKIVTNFFRNDRVSTEQKITVAQNNTIGSSSNKPTNAENEVVAAEAENSQIGTKVTNETQNKNLSSSSTPNIEQNSKNAEITRVAGIGSAGSIRTSYKETSAVNAKSSSIPQGDTPLKSVNIVTPADKTTTRIGQSSSSQEVGMVTPMQDKRQEPASADTNIPQYNDYGNDHDDYSEFPTPEIGVSSSSSRTLNEGRTRADKRKRGEKVANEPNSKVTKSNEEERTRADKRKRGEEFTNEINPTNENHDEGQTSKAKKKRLSELDGLLGVVAETRVENLRPYIPTSRGVKKRNSKGKVGNSL